MDSLAEKRRRTPAQQSDPPIWGKEMGLRCDPATTRDYLWSLPPILQDKDMERS